MGHWYFDRTGSTAPTVAADVHAVQRAVGQAILGERRRLGWTLTQLGRRAAVDPVRLDHIELGRGQFCLFSIARVARVLGRPVTWFLAGAGSARPPR